MNCRARVRPVPDPPLEIGDKVKYWRRGEVITGFIQARTISNPAFYDVRAGDAVYSNIEREDLELCR